jgi:hypothetical protein
MVALPEPQDPTLAAADRALEDAGNRNYNMPSIPMSSIGAPCDRAIWYAFRWAAIPWFSADTIKKFEDGHHCEDAQARRLRRVQGLDLWTIDPDTGKQFEAVLYDGHFKGRIDGLVLGLIQSPKRPAIWEHKATDETKLRKLEKLKAEHGEKNALHEWDYRYWATAQCYMRCFEIDRHYLTVSSPGGRRTISCRTEYDAAEAEKLLARADRLIKADRAPPRISEDPSWYQCKMCDFHAVCHQGAPAAVTCRSCLFSSPMPAGHWECAKFELPMDRDEQRLACSQHLFLPSLVNGEQIDASDDGEWVEYRLKSGEIWRNETKAKAI